MKKTSFTLLHSLKWMVMPLVLTVLCCNFAMAQCQMSCNDNVQVSLNDDCEAVITYDVMLEDPDNPHTCSPNGPSAYFVQILDDHGHPVNEFGEPAIVTCDDIGTRTVRVKHWASGNFCWGSISVKDKMPPRIECREIELWCNQDYSIEALGEPNVTDNCDDRPNAIDCDVFVLEHVQDRWDDLDCSSDGISAIVYREWKATDACGNWTTCEEVIILRRLVLCVGVDEHWNCIPNPEIDFPADLDDIDAPAIDCNDPCAARLKTLCDDDPSNDDPAFDCTGYPQVHHEDLGDPDDACEINIFWEDNCVEICGGGNGEHVGSFKILREFTLLDWCTGDIYEFTQLIKVIDRETNIICPAPITVGTNLGPQECGWIGNIPPATPDEDCSWADVTTKIYGHRLHGHIWVYELIETIDGNGGGPVVLDGKPCEALYDIVYEIEDDCGNHASCTTPLTIVDDDEPTVVCDEITQVTLEANPLVVDDDADGSCDGGAVAIVYAATFDDGSHDNCCASEDLTFEVRRMGTSAWGPFITFDCDDVCETVMVEMRVWDCCDNVSESCMVEVLVDDKTPPVITCPPDMEVACFDVADPSDNDQVKQYLDQNDIKATATDNCCLDRIECQIIQNTTNECGIGRVRVRYTAYDQACPENSSSCIQTIEFIDPTPIVPQFPPDRTLFCEGTEGGGFTGGTDPSDLGAPYDTVQISGDDCELLAVNHFDEFFPISDGACFKILRRWVVINWCIFDPNGPQTPDNGYWSHIQEIKVLDDEQPIVDCQDQQVCITEGCTVDYELCRPDIMDCVPDDFISVTYEGDLGEGVIAGDCVTIPDVGPGTYEITLNIFDNCGNATKCVFELKVEDCKKPTPYCVNGLVIELMPTTGMVDVWAVDFDAGSFDNCPGDLQLSFSDDPSDVGKTLTCDDLGTQTITLWVTDEAGNQDFCETFVIVQDNMGGCDGDPVDPLVAGTVTTEMDDNVDQVTVAVNGGMNETMVTDASGTFGFNLPVGGDYTLTPERDMDALNGVTTFDLVVMRKHILGSELLDSPYKLIAADINNSQGITTFDMVELRKLVLQVNTEFPNNTSWRFVANSYVFPDPSNPWVEVFPEIININDLSADQMASDFVAIKIGDLNNSATPNNLVTVDERTNGQLTFNVADEALKAGETYTVTFAADLVDVEGYQFTLTFDENALQLNDIVEGVAKGENFGTTMVAEGAITTSWDGVAVDGEVFGLTFTALADAQLSDVLAVSSRYTKAQAYNKSGETLDVAIQFNSGSVSTAGFELYQNTPNPFSEVTQIGFNLPQAGNATLTVHDVTGKVITTIRGDYAKGFNQINLTKAQLNANGVLYYTLETADFTATRKMILVK